MQEYLKFYLGVDQNFESLKDETLNIYHKEVITQINNSERVTNGLVIQINKTKVITKPSLKSLKEYITITSSYYYYY